MLISATIGGTVQQLSTVHDLPVGARLVKVRRAVYVQRATITASGGDLELSFDSGQVFSFGVAGNGESLAIEPNAWAEHFPEPVSEENREFLWTSGCWEILDVGTAFWSHRQFLSKQLIRKEAIGENELVLDFDGLQMRIKVTADDLHVEFLRG